MLLVAGPVLFALPLVVYKWAEVKPHYLPKDKPRIIVVTLKPATFSYCIAYFDTALAAFDFVERKVDPQGQNLFKKLNQKHVHFIELTGFALYHS